MTQRIKFYETGLEAIKSMATINQHLNTSSLDKRLLELVNFRVSEINGCAFCLDMHSKELLADGESAQRLLVLNSWREAPFYTDRERAALAWAEAVTILENRQVSEDVFEELKKHFTEVEMIDLTLAITAINSYNRFNIAFGAPVGTYQVGQFN